MMNHRLVSLAMALLNPSKESAPTHTYPIEYAEVEIERPRIDNAIRRKEGMVGLGQPRVQCVLELWLDR